jgi:hypothetical protein
MNISFTKGHDSVIINRPVLTDAYGSKQIFESKSSWLKAWDKAEVCGVHKDLCATCVATSNLIRATIVLLSFFDIVT